MVSSRWKPAIIITLVWVAYYLVSIVQSLTVQRQIGSSVDSLPTIVLRLVPNIGFWAVLTPLLIWLARRFRIDRHSWRRNLPIHFGVSIAASYVYHWAWVYWREIMHLGSMVRPRPFLAGWLSMIDLSVFIYFVIVAIVHAMDYDRWYQQRREQARDLELRASQLEGQLTSARLQLLKMQLQPHFLFNTLHAIAELVHEDPRVADGMLTGLGDMLRRSLDHDGGHQVELREELSLLESYLAIEQIRFRDRLHVVYEIEPATLDAIVPHLLLQPLVENAIRHGIAPRLGPGCVRIASRRMDGRLEIRVEDDGVGVPAGQPLREGVGLSNTRGRLQQLYRADHSFELTVRDGGGLVAALDLPYQIGSGAGGLESEPVALMGS